MLKKKSLSWLAFMGVLSLGVSAAVYTGCGGDDDDDDDDDATEGETPTPTPEPASPTPEPATPTPEPATPTPTPNPVTVTFTVDTTHKADGTNELAKVLEGESVYMVGAFNGWDPNAEAQKLFDDGTHGDTTAADGIYSIQLTFPLTQGTTTWAPGSTTEFPYKFAKTTAGTASAPWDNSLKDFFTDAEKDCSKPDAETKGCLWQITKDTGNSTVDDASHNFLLNPIPSEDTTIHYVADAWETYAVTTFGIQVGDL